MIPPTLRPLIAAVALVVVVGTLGAFARGEVGAARFSARAPRTPVGPITQQGPRIVRDGSFPDDGRARFRVIPAAGGTVTTIILTGTGRLGSFRFTDALMKATPKS